MAKKFFLSLMIIFLSLFFLYSNDPDEQAADAVNRNKLFQLKSALKKGANINLPDKDGSSLLMRAIEKNYFKIAEYLINGNADLSIKNNSGKNAMDIAADKKNNDIIVILENKVSIDNLLLKIKSLTEYNLTGTNKNNLGDFDLKYKDQTADQEVGIKFVTQDIFGFITTLFKVNIDQVEFKGDIKVSGRKLQKNTFDFNINNQIIAGTITSDYYEDMKKTYYKYTLNLSAAGGRFEGEVINNINDDKMLYRFKLDKTGDKITGIRYCNKLESFYDIKINENQILGKKTNKGEYFIKTDIKSGYLYLFLLLDIYFDNLNFQTKN